MILKLFSKKVERKLGYKWKAYMREHVIFPNAVRIFWRAGTIPLNINKTINAKEKHFSLVCSCALATYKLQGNYDEIVCEYDENHSMELALSRVNRI